MERTDIYITQGKDYCEMTRELLEACDLASDIGLSLIHISEPTRH